MSDEIVRLVAVTGLAKYSGLEDMLTETLYGISEGEITQKKGILLLIDDECDNFGVHVTNAGLKCSQMIAAAKVLETEALQHMGYLPEAE